MNPTQAILGLVNKTTLAAVLDQTSLINLETMSTDNTGGSGSSKLQGVSRPSYDSTLKAISSNNDYQWHAGRRRTRNYKGWPSCDKKENTLTKCLSAARICTLEIMSAAHMQTIFKCRICAT